MASTGITNFRIFARKKKPENGKKKLSNAYMKPKALSRKNITLATSYVMHKNKIILSSPFSANTDCSIFFSWKIPQLRMFVFFSRFDVKTKAIKNTKKKRKSPLS